jgi:DNA invertase Pin-like site-specific DNA recombinase
MPKVFGYARGSTNEQEDTLVNQKEELEKEYAHRFQKDYEWGGVFTDRGVSGSVELGRRSQGHQLKLGLERGDVVLITKLDRGFRNARDFLANVAEWRDKGIRLVLMDLAIDTGVPVGEMLGGILALVAQFERRMIAARTKAVMDARKKQGRPVSGKEPYGFKLGGPKGQRHFVPDPITRAAGKKIVEWIDGGWTFESVYWHMRVNLILTRRGGEWKKTSIQRAYVGEKRLQEREKEQATKKGEQQP